MSSITHEQIIKDFVAAKDAEIQRLHSELNMEIVARRKVEDELAEYMVAVQKRNAEIERLREELSDSREAAEDWKQRWRDANADER